MDERQLDDLEQRLSAIEDRVLPKDGDDKKLMKVLSDVNETLTTFSAKRERFKQMFRRVPAVAEYLSPGFVGVVGMDNTCEKEVVLSAEKELIEMSKQLEEIQSLSDVLDSQEILEIPNHDMRLNKLQLIQQNQLDKLSNTSDELNSLASAYNDLVTSVTETFVKWDFALSKLEEQREE